MLQLLPAIFQVAFSLSLSRLSSPVEVENGGFHTALHSAFQLDIFVKFHIGPVVDQLYVFVSAANTVNTSKTLDDAYGIPMDIVVDQIVAVLQVLTLRDTVCSDEYIDVFMNPCASWHSLYRQNSPLSLEMGEKKVSDVLKMSLKLGMVHLPSVCP